MELNQPNQYPGGSELLDPKHILQDIVEMSYEAKVASLGCGAMAYFTMAAAKIVGNKGQVYAGDILKEVLSSVEAKARHDGLYNVKTVWTNLEVIGATKIPEASLDYAMLINVLFQNQKHLEVLHEARRLLKLGGQLIVVEWKAAGGPLGPAKEKRLEQADVERMAKEVGFNKVKDFDASQYHYGIIFVK